MPPQPDAAPIGAGARDAVPPVSFEFETTAAPTDTRSKIGRWLLKGLHHTGTPAQHPTYPWWKVMCLTGVDYFSTLGYQPGIAFLAAGVLSPVATLVLVLVTLFVAVPVYAEVARRSPHGQGSIRMLEELLPRWKGKLFVLVLLGFAFTGFIITITLSAADATVHILENPMLHGLPHQPVAVTLVLLFLLAGIFLKGFKEAIGLAVGIVALYLGLNAALLFYGFREVLAHPDLWSGWRAALDAQHGNPLAMFGVAAILFPKLALGLSGFETGVAVMPLVRGSATDTAEEPRARIRNTRKLLVGAALIMSAFLIGSSLVTTLLIPAEAFQSGGEANGRALAFLAHRLLGETFGTAYDIATIAILWFAGASAMVGLLNLVPLYLPPYGMAPDWARATRPLVLVFTAVAALVTILFGADVEAQAGAYATGVLFLMASAALASAIANRGTRKVWVFAPMTAIFAYTVVNIVIERPEGIKIAAWFIVAIVTTSLLSRAVRSTELRILTVRLDPAAQAEVDALAAVGVKIIAHRPDRFTEDEYDKKERQAREDHSLDHGEPVLFLEVVQGDASDFTEDLEVIGVRVGRHRILRCVSPAIPNAIAALLLHIRDLTGKIPDAYFGWTEGNPLMYVLRYLALGEGDTAPVTREVLRKTVKIPTDRPRIHVG
jgi:amino acid permease